jgi:hypothetical protein
MRRARKVENKILKKWDAGGLERKTDLGEPQHMGCRLVLSG